MQIQLWDHNKCPEYEYRLARAPLYSTSRLESHCLPVPLQPCPGYQLPVGLESVQDPCIRQLASSP